MNIKEAIILILKRYQLYDLNIPQIINQFFIDNQKKFYEKDDEFYYVETLKQQALEDKIYFDNDQIFNNVKIFLCFFNNKKMLFLGFTFNVCT